MTGTEFLRAVIIDDEPLARRGLHQHLRRHSDVEMIGEAGDGPSAVDLIANSDPDLAFLDIAMPGMSGLEVAAALDPAALPTLVFVTAYDQYAVDAFEIQAFDYLLKPIDPDRFDQTMERVRRKARAEAGRDHSQDFSALLRRMRARETAPRLVLREAGALKILPLAEIDLVETAGNYVELHCGAERHLWRRTLTGLEAELPSHAFVRVHRSTLVRVEAIRELHPRPHGDFELTLAGGRKVAGSRRYRESVRNRLEGEAGPPRRG